MITKNVSNISWEDIVKRSFFKNDETISNTNIKHLTQNVAKKILSEQWCKAHYINTVQHRNNILCHLFKKLCTQSTEEKLISELFCELTNSTDDKISTAPLTQPFLSSFQSDKTIKSQINQLIKDAMNYGIDSLASEILSKITMDDLQNLIMEAARSASLVSLEIILQKLPADSSDTKEALIYYCQQKFDNPEVLTLLLDYANGNYDYNNLLMKAYESSNINIIKKLLELGADPNKLSDQGKNAFHVAADIWSNSNFNSTFIPLLIEYNGDINSLDANNNTALDISLKHNWDEGVTAKVLLKHGAKKSCDFVDVNEKSSLKKELELSLPAPVNIVTN
ncbi:MAG: ankyrin repeat domain-containing protein [Chlamydiota bacterium]|nr:ankyrin repeat domain-containing protein [Chlamydiota bacterium]